MAKLLRVAIDTNHIISAILSDRGASAKLIDWMTQEEDYFHLRFPVMLSVLTTFSNKIIFRQLSKTFIKEAVELFINWLRQLAHHGRINPVDFERMEAQYRSREEIAKHVDQSTRTRTRYPPSRRV